MVWSRNVRPAVLLSRHGSVVTTPPPVTAHAPRLAVWTSKGLRGESGGWGRGRGLEAAPWNTIFLKQVALESQHSLPLAVTESTPLFTTHPARLKGLALTAVDIAVTGGHAQGVWSLAEVNAHASSRCGCNALH